MHLQVIFGGVKLAPDTRGQLIGGLRHALDLAMVVQPKVILF
jgi:hypothetical protein